MARPRFVAAVVTVTALLAAPAAVATAPPPPAAAAPSAGFPILDVQPVSGGGITAPGPVTFAWRVAHSAALTKTVVRTASAGPGKTPKWGTGKVLPATASTLRLPTAKAGSARCIQVQALDTTGAASAPLIQCNQVAWDNKALKASRGWTVVKTSGAVGGTVSRSARTGATLTLTGLPAGTYQVMALTGPGAGTLDVLVDKKRVKAQSLAAKAPGSKTITVVVKKRGKHTLVLRVGRGSKPVTVDAVYAATRTPTPQPVAGASTAAPVSGLTATTVTRSGVTLAWTPPPGTKTVTVRRVTGTTPTTARDGGTPVPVKGVTASDTGLNADTDYAYTVWAQAKNGAWSAPVGLSVHTTSTDGTWTAPASTTLPPATAVTSAAFLPATSAGARAQVTLAADQHPAVGGGIIIQPTGDLTGGFVGVITSLTTNPDGTTVTLRQAAINEVLASADLSLRATAPASSETLTGADLGLRGRRTVRATSPDGTFGTDQFKCTPIKPLEPGTDIDSVLTTLDKTFAGKIEFSDIEYGAVINFGTGPTPYGPFDLNPYVSFHLHIDAAFELKAGVHCEILPALTDAISLYVTKSLGPIPLGLTIEPSLYWDLTASATLTNSYDADLYAGARITGYWIPAGPPVPNPPENNSDISVPDGNDWLPPGITAEPNLKVETELGADVGITFGPGVATEPVGLLAGIEGTMHGALNAETDWQGRLCIKAKAEVTAKIDTYLGAWLFGWDWTLPKSIPLLSEQDLYEQDLPDTCLTDLQPLRRVVDADGLRACAVKVDGSVWCWEWPGKWEQVAGTANTRYVSTVGFQPHTCAVSQDGGLWCWGENRAGQLGVGDTEDRTTPTRVALNGDVRMVDTSTDTTCAVLTNAQLWCWGDVSWVVTGLSPIQQTSVPLKIAEGVSSVAVGGGTCTVMTNGSLRCWGLGNVYGELGTGDTEAHRQPVTIMNEGVTDVQRGFYNACALKSDGGLWCWGLNHAGPLGLPETGMDAIYPTPTKVPTPALTSFALSNSLFDPVTCGITDSGAMWCWGTSGYTSTPAVTDVTDALAVATGATSWCAVTSDRALWCTGFAGAAGWGEKRQIMPSGSIAPV